MHNGFELSNKFDVSISFNGGYIPYNHVSQSVYGTYIWAVLAGFPHEYAKNMAYHCNDVDDKFSPFDKDTQAWHFNVNRNTQGAWDTRGIIAFILIFAVYENFETARELKQNGMFNYKWFVSTGIKYLGYALHPLQDFYSHTDDRVYYVKGTGYWSHIRINDDTDNPFKRWKQLNKTAASTLEILCMIYEEFEFIFY